MPHPFIEVLAHISSPLTGAWTVYGVQKLQHVSSMQAYLQARRVLAFSARNAAGLDKQGGAAADIAALPVSAERHMLRQPATNTVAASTAKRAFSTFAAQGSRTAVPRASPFCRPAQGLRSFSSLTAAAVPPHGAVATHSMYSWEWLSQHFPIDQVQTSITAIHESTGWSWAASIMSLTLGFRLLVFPLNVSLIRNTLRLAAVDEQVQVLSQKMSTASDSAEKRTAAQELMALFRSAKCHPMKNLISPVIFAPTFLTIFAAVNRLSDAATAHLHPGITDGGFAWFHDLTAADPTLVLPSLSAFTWLVSIELGLRGIPTWDRSSALTNILRFLPAVFLPVTFHLPAGVFMYWLTSNLFAILRLSLMQISAFRRLMRVP